ncbi:MAG: divergent polysaccharide deacetylase family protein [Pseudomonadota bacterium]
MSAVKLLAGFIIGLIACIIILILISIRAPITIENAQGNPVVRTEDTVVARADDQDNIEQNENKESFKATEDPAEDEISEEEAEIPEETSQAETELSEEYVSNTDVASAETEEIAEEAITDEATPEEAASARVLLDTSNSNTSSISQLQTGQSSLLTDRTGQTSRLRLSADPDQTNAPSRDEDQTPAPLSAFAKNALEFTPNGKPLLAIVLIDVESDGLSQAELLKLPFKASFALSVASSNVQFAQRDYWTSGFEIVSLIPEDQADALIASGGEEDAVRSYLELIYQKMPMTLGVVDFPTANIQKQRRVFIPLLSVLAETGHGFFSYAVGINNTGREAANLGMPSASITRVLDQNGEDGQAIQNYLSNAARAADRQGASIVIGRATQTTVSAIQAWLETSSAASVQIAPLSAATLLQR